MRITEGFGLRRAGELACFALFVVGRVVGAIVFQTSSEFATERGCVFRLRVPVDVERLDFCAQEMVGARGAEFREAGGVVRVDEAEDFFIVLHGADHALLRGDVAAQPREDGCENGAAFLCRECLVFRSAEGCRVAALRCVLGFDVGGCLFNEIESVCVALLLVIGPGDEAMLAHHDRVHVWLLGGDLLHGEAEFEAGAHPWARRPFLLRKSSESAPRNSPTRRWR